MTEGASDLGVIVALAGLSLLGLIIGWKCGFFSFPAENRVWNVPIRLHHVLLAFAAYFLAAMWITPFLGALIRKSYFPDHTAASALGFASWLNFLNSSLIFLFLGILSLATLPISVKIWRKNPHQKNSYTSDISYALYAWLISYPIVLFLSQSLDWLVTTLFQLPKVPEQVAVYFLKMTFANPIYLTLTVLTIIIFAPLIEEILFRGALQSYIRQHLGSSQSIFITAVLFSLFHYSPEQGLGNIPIIGALFVLALFLGFIYEKKGSLFAPIVLHASFNAFSVMNLYFLGGFPKGPL